MGIFWSRVLPRNSLQNTWRKQNPALPQSCLVLKSPCKEYSIGQRRERDEKTLAPKFKQNSRKISPGTRVKLFHLMREMYLVNRPCPVMKVEKCCGEINTRRFANIGLKMVRMIGAHNSCVKCTGPSANLKAV
jgi:hypothetical protein